MAIRHPGFDDTKLGNEEAGCSRQDPSRRQLNVLLDGTNSVPGEGRPPHRAFASASQSQRVESHGERVVTSVSKLWAGTDAMTADYVHIRFALLCRASAHATRGGAGVYQCGQWVNT